MTGADSHIISQRTIAGGPVFRFHEDYLEYFGFDMDFKVRYEQISSELHYRQLKKKDPLVPIVTCYFIFVALALLSHETDRHVGAAGMRWFLYSLGTFILALSAVLVPRRYLVATEYTVIPVKHDTISIQVANDKRKAGILQELQARRLQSLRRLSAPEPANSPEEELRKLKWLRDEKALSEEEYLLLSFQARETE